MSRVNAIALQIPNYPKTEKEFLQLMEERSTTPKVLGERWSCSPLTVRREIRRGRLRGWQLPGGDFRIWWADAIAYETEHEIEV